MAIKIIDEYEPVGVEGLVTVIFGDPGIGKTSLSMQVEDGFLIDFDGGLHRAKNKCKAARLDNWSDMVDLQKGQYIEKGNFKTLIIDTAGTMLDNFIAQFAMRMDVKNKRTDGSLSLQGFGALKNIFTAFVAWAKSQNINLIFVCHAEQFKEGDEVKYRPKMTGGSYDILVQQADLMGYMNSQNNTRTLEFTHTDKHVGKNTGELPLLKIPEYTSAEFSGFMQRIIDQTKEAILKVSGEQLEVMKRIDFYKNTIDGIINPAELEAVRIDVMKENNAIQLQIIPVLKRQMLNIFLDQISEITEPEQALAIVEDANQLNEIFRNDIKRSLMNHCKKIGIAYNEEKKMFEKAETKAETKQSKEPSPLTHPNPNVKVSVEQSGKTPVTVYEMPNRQKSTPVQPELQMESPTPAKNGRTLI